MEYNMEPEESSNNMTENNPPTKETAMNGVDENGHGVVSKQEGYNGNDDFGDFGVSNVGETGDVANTNDEGSDDNVVQHSTEDEEIANNDTADVPGLVTEEQEEAGHSDNNNDDEMEKTEIETDGEFKTPFASEASSPPQSENNFLDCENENENENENAVEASNEDTTEDDDIDEKISVNEKEAKKEVGMDLLDFGTETTTEEPSQPISTLDHSENAIGESDGVEPEELMTAVENSSSAQDNFSEPLSAEPEATPDEGENLDAFDDSTNAVKSTPALVDPAALNDFAEPVSTESAATPDENDNDNFIAFCDAAKPEEAISSPAEVSASDDFGDFGEPVSTEPATTPEHSDNFKALGDYTKSAEESTPPKVQDSPSDDFGDFGDFGPPVSTEPAETLEGSDNVDVSVDSTKPAKSAPPAIEASASDDFGDFGEPVATPEDGDNFDAFGDSTKSAEESAPPEVQASASDDFGDFGEAVATPEEGDNFDAFGDSTKPTEESAPPEVQASASDDFGDFGEAVSKTTHEDGDNFDAFGDSTKPETDASETPVIEASPSDDFGDFGEPVSGEPAENPEDGGNFDAFGDSMKKVQESTPPEVQASASDDFGDFGEPVSAEAVPNAEEQDGFGDFGDATVPTEATPPVVSDDFGDFGEPVETESKAMPQTEDGFGVSGEVDKEDTLDQSDTARRDDTQAFKSTAPLDDDDDFGDFGEFDEAEVTPVSEEKQKPSGEADDDDFGDFGDFDEAQSGTPVQEVDENNTQEATQPTASEDEFNDFGTFDESGSVPPKDPLLEKAEAIFLTAFSKYGAGNGEDINSSSESEEHVSIGSVLASLSDKKVSKESQLWYESTLNAGLLDVKILGKDKAEVIVSDICVYPNEHHAFPGSFQRNFQPNKEEIKKIETNASLPTVPEVLSIELPTGDKVRKPAIPEGSKDVVDPSLISSATVVELPPLAADKGDESDKKLRSASSTKSGVPLSLEAPIEHKESAGDNEDFGDFEAFGDSDVSFAPISEDMMTSSEKEQATIGEELDDDFGKFGSADSGEIKTRNSGNENNIATEEDDFGEFDDEKCSTPAEVSEQLPPETAKLDADDDDGFGDFGDFSEFSSHTELPKEEKSDTKTSGEVPCADTLVSNSEEGRNSDSLNSLKRPKNEDSTDASPPVASAAEDEEFAFGDFGEAEASSRASPSPATEANSIDHQTDPSTNGFGSFGAVSTSESIEGVEKDANEMNPDNDDSFGDFGEAPVSSNALELLSENTAVEESGKFDGNHSNTKPLGAEGTELNDHSFGDFGEAADSPIEPLPQAAVENTDNTIEASKSDDFGDFGDFVSEAQTNYANSIDADPAQGTQPFGETGTVTLAPSDSAIMSAEASSDQKNTHALDDDFGDFISDVQPVHLKKMDSDEGDDDEAFGNFDTVSPDGQSTEPDVKHVANESNDVTDFGSFTSTAQSHGVDTNGGEPVQTENSVADIGGAITSSDGTTTHQSSYHEAEIKVTTSDDFGEFGDFSDVQAEMSAKNQSDPSTQVSDSSIGCFEQPLAPLAASAPGISESINPLHNGTVDFTTSSKDPEVFESANPAVSSPRVEDQDTDFWVFEDTNDPKASTPEQTASQWVDVGETQQVSAPNTQFQDVPAPNADEDSFGDFGTANDPTPAIGSTTEQIMPQTADMSDEFGDFEEITAAPTQDINGVQEESDDFGDFEGAAKDTQNESIFEQTSDARVAPQGLASSLDENDDFGDFTSSAEPVPKEAIDIVGPFLARVPDWSYMLKTEYQAPQLSQVDSVSNEKSIGIQEPLDMNGFH